MNHVGQIWESATDTSVFQGTRNHLLGRTEIVVSYCAFEDRIFLSKQWMTGVGGSPRHPTRPPAGLRFFCFLRAIIDTVIVSRIGLVDKLNKAVIRLTKHQPDAIMKLSVPLVALCVVNVATTAAFLAPQSSTTVRPASKLFTLMDELQTRIVASPDLYRTDYPAEYGRGGSLGVYQGQNNRNQMMRQTQYGNDNQQHNHMNYDRHTDRQLQGGSRGLYQNPYNSRSQNVYMETDGRPLQANIDLWQGPNNSPQRMRVWSEDGRTRPFQSTVATPYGMSSMMDVRNTGPMEFPMRAGVTPSRDGPLGTTQLFQDQRSFEPRSSKFGGLGSSTKTIQGDGGLKYFTVDSSVASVQVNIWNQGRPFFAKVEILQGPNSVRQVADVYVDDSRNRPFSSIVQTPGYGSTIIVRNTGPMAFPLTATVEPYSRRSSSSHSESAYRRNNQPTLNGGNSRGSMYGYGEMASTPYQDNRNHHLGYSNVGSDHNNWSNSGGSPGNRMIGPSRHYDPSQNQGPRRGLSHNNNYYNDNHRHPANQGSYFDPTQNQGPRQLMGNKYNSSPSGSSPYYRMNSYSRNSSSNNNYGSGTYSNSRNNYNQGEQGYGIMGAPNSGSAVYRNSNYASRDHQYSNNNNNQYYGLMGGPNPSVGGNYQNGEFFFSRH
jgi:hypothetical protein